jgi:hypothetical protein
VDDRAVEHQPGDVRERLTPLLVSPDLETHSGAMFDQQGNAILPSAKLRDESLGGWLAALGDFRPWLVRSVIVLDRPLFAQQDRSLCF